MEDVYRKPATAPRRAASHTPGDANPSDDAASQGKSQRSLPDDSRLLEALGLSPAIVGRGSSLSYSHGFDSSLSIAASAAPYASVATPPASMGLQGQSGTPALSTAAAPALQLGLLSIGQPATSQGRAAAAASNAGQGRSARGGAFSSPQWGWYVSLTPPTGVPGSRSIAAAAAAQENPRTAPYDAHSAQPVPVLGTPDRHTDDHSRRRPSSDGYDLYVSGLGLPTA